MNSVPCRDKNFQAIVKFIDMRKDRQTDLKTTSPVKVEIWHQAEVTVFGRCLSEYGLRNVRDLGKQRSKT